MQKTKIPADATIEANVSIARNESGFYLSAELNVRLPGIEQEKAQALVDAAHQMCPYSKATRNNIEVKLNVL